MYAYEHSHGARNFEVMSDNCNKDIICAPVINYCRGEYGGGGGDDDDDDNNNFKHSNVVE